MTQRDIRKVAVIGAGTMGPGMAATFARNASTPTRSFAASISFHLSATMRDKIVMVEGGGWWVTGDG